MYEAAEKALQSLSTERLLQGYSTDAYDQTFRALGPTAHSTTISMVTWDRCGQHVYVVGPKVADALRRTDLTGVKPSMIKAPHQVFYIALPDCPWEQWGGEDTQWHRVTGVYVSYQTRLNPRTFKPELGLTCVVWGAPNERSRHPLDDIVYWFSVPIGDCPEDSDLEQYYSESSVASEVFGESSEFSSTNEEHKAKQGQTASNVFRLAVSLLLYVQSEGAEIEEVDREPERKKIRAAIKRAKKPGNKKKLQRRLDNIPKTVIRYIGPKMERKFADAEREYTERISDGSRSSPVRHLVRPHFNYYWVGSGETKRRVSRWIAPYERGVDPERIVTVVRETTRLKE